MVVAVTDPNYIKDLREKHGISDDLLPGISTRSVMTDNERLLTAQKDTVAYQWATEFAKMEQLSRTCLYCDFVAKTRVSLKAHMKKHIKP
jgi:hypothetical protein